MGALLEVKNLSVAFGNDKQSVTVIDDLTFSLNKGETLGHRGGKRQRKKRDVACRDAPAAQGDRPRVR